MTKRTPELVARAASLRAQGFTWDVVGGSCGVTGSTARYWVVEADRQRRRRAALARYAPRPPRQRPPALRETFCIRLTAAMATELERRAEAAGSRRSTVLRELLAGALGSSVTRENSP